MRVVKKKVFVDERWSRNRNVTSMDWSTHVRAFNHTECSCMDFLVNTLTA